MGQRASFQQVVSYVFYLKTLKKDVPHPIKGTEGKEDIETKKQEILDKKGGSGNH